MRDLSVFINSVWGLPKAVVDGSIDPDVIVVAPGEEKKIIYKQIKLKEQEYFCDSEEGVCRLEAAGDKASLQSVSDEKCLELAAMAQALEDHYGSPQDIEWAISQDGFVNILQCRPLVQSGDVVGPEHSLRDREPEAPILVRGGITASRGVAYGPVLVARSDMDKLRFPDKAVLVTAQALPAWAPLLGRAAALVTEVGGWLANVAREFGIPAICGISEATNILENGQLVTVDADGRTVYGGRADSLRACQKITAAILIRVDYGLGA